MRLTVSALLGLTGCSSGGSDATAGTGQLELYSWWTHPGESDALSALIDLYHTKYPKREVINATVESITDAQQQLRTRMIGGQPPDTFQVVGGGDLTQWVAYNGQDDTESKMDPWILSPRPTIGRASCPNRFSIWSVTTARCTAFRSESTV